MVCPRTEARASILGQVHLRTPALRKIIPRFGCQSCTLPRRAECQLPAQWLQAAPQPPARPSALSLRLPHPPARQAPAETRPGPTLRPAGSCRLARAARGGRRPAFSQTSRGHGRPHRFPSAARRRGRRKPHPGGVHARAAAKPAMAGLSLWTGPGDPETLDWRGFRGARLVRLLGPGSTGRGAQRPRGPGPCPHCSPPGTPHGKPKFPQAQPAERAPHTDLGRAVEWRRRRLPPPRLC